MADIDIFKPANCCCHCKNIKGISEEEKLICGKHNIEISDYLVCNYFKFNRTNEQLASGIKKDIEEANSNYSNSSGQP